MFKIITFILAVIFSFSAYATEETLSYKIGQMIMVGFRGTEINNNSSIVKNIKENKIGGVIYFDYDTSLKKYDRNIKSKEQLNQLSKDLQSYTTDLPLFIAVDSEGGKVQRLKGKYGFSEIMSAEKIGNMDNLSITKWEATKNAKSLKSVGVNLNFAPVVDVNVNPENPVIGKLGRAYSEDAIEVYKQASATIDRYRINNIITCLKHFPGHGSAYNDSHLGLTDISDTWTKDELIPYNKLINDNKVDMIMMGHLFNKNIDSQYPASISKNFTDILRNELNYDGVLVSDDMQMKAISKYYTLEEQVDLFLASSMDIILFGNNLSYDENIANKIFDLIYNKTKNNPELKMRINESFNRIKKLKSKI